MISLSDFATFFLIYILVNGVVFFIFASDKIKAGKNSWRTPENQLLVFALIGPFGAFAAMQVFRHKTRKLKFCLVPVCAMLHIILLTWILLYFIQ
jgi:uncharacterized membrane protein YsdA (DUF1294 family)